jgi:hypothetical protein
LGFLVLVFLDLCSGAFISPAFRCLRIADAFASFAVRLLSDIGPLHSTFNPFKVQPSSVLLSITSKSHEILQIYLDSYGTDVLTSVVKISQYPRRTLLTSNLENLTSFVSHSCALFCSFLHFFALTQNSTRFFSSASALFRENTGGGVGPHIPSRAPSRSERHPLFAHSLRSLHQERFTTLLQSNGSALFLETAGCHLTIPILERITPLRAPLRTQRLCVIRFLSSLFNFQLSTVNFPFLSAESAACR